MSDEDKLDIVEKILGNLERTIIDRVDHLESKFERHEKYETLILEKMEKAPVFNGGFDKLLNDIEYIKKNQEAMKENITSMKRNMYEPETGIYPKIQDLHSQVHDLEIFKNKIDPDIIITVDRLDQWKLNTTKVMWFLGTGMIGLLIKLAFDVVGN